MSVPPSPPIDEQLPRRPSPKARTQLEALYRYIAEEASRDIARRYTDAIVDQCQRLADFPRRGTPRDDLRPGLRTFVFRRRVVIAYAVEPGVVTILELLFAGQDAEALLREE
jgi:plasmid stabilization system protein ParE